jgi:hypothetical protein
MLYMFRCQSGALLHHHTLSHTRAYLLSLIETSVHDSLMLASCVSKFPPFFPVYGDGVSGSLSGTSISSCRTRRRKKLACWMIHWRRVHLRRVSAYLNDIIVALAGLLDRHRRRFTSFP